MHKNICSTLVLLLVVVLTSAVVAPAVAAGEDKKRERKTSSASARVLDRGLEKTVRKLRDRAVAGGRKASRDDARAHFRRAADELSSALNESPRDAKKVDYERPKRPLRPDDDLEEAQDGARDLLEEADKRRGKGDLTGEAVRLRIATHLAGGLREYSAARIAETLPR